jgi:prevent-host-death family protein
MKTEVKIAELKSRLSEYLRSVRRGNEVIVKDRDTPIARLVPYEERKQRLIVRPATASLKDIDKLLAKLPRPKGLKPGEVDRALKWVKRDVSDKGLV